MHCIEKEPVLRAVPCMHMGTRAIINGCYCVRPHPHVLTWEAYVITMIEKLSFHGFFIETPLHITSSARRVLVLDSIDSALNFLPCLL